MTILIGVDEAGYGPNLGPLVISLTAWRLAGAGNGLDDQPTDLYQLLGAVVASAADDERLTIADSKQLYQPQKRDLSTLERGVLASLAAAGHEVRSWSGLLRATEADPGANRLALPWYANFDCDLPIDHATAELAEYAVALGAALSHVNCELLMLHSRIVFPEEFNATVEREGTKGAALSHFTLQLLRSALSHRRTRATAVHLDHWDDCRQRWLAFCAPPETVTTWDEPVRIVCDKHGGRDRYADLLRRYFPECHLRIEVEGRAESRYRLQVNGGPLAVSFCSGGERFLPTALASMTSKYVREVSMNAFNDFWQTHVPGIRRTAGYPVDAKRFYQEIRQAQRRLGIDDRRIWRMR